MIETFLALTVLQQILVLVATISGVYQIVLFLALIGGAFAGNRVTVSLIPGFVWFVAVLLLIIL